jgi:outer membrane protein TolC
VYSANIIRAEASRLSYQTGQEMYHMGKVSLIDLYVINRIKIEAESELVQSRYNLFLEQIILEYYAGLHK